MGGCYFNTKNYLTQYQFLDTRNGERAAKTAIEKLPHGTCGEIVRKGFKLIASDIKTVGKDFFDIGLYLCLVAPLRTCGICRPEEPTPPVFDSPHDDGEFIQYSIERALWRWDEEKGKQLREDISCLSGESMPIIAQWTLAYSYDNLEKRKDYLIPSFLSIYESHENIRKAFSQLKPLEKKAILDTLYRQEDLKLACCTGKQVRKIYNDIRGLAYKLTQGNKNFTAALQEYVEKVAQSAESTAPVSTEAPSRTSPSAPAQATNLMTAEREMTRDVAFMRRALMDSTETMSPPVKNKLIETIQADRKEVPHLPRAQVVNPIPNPSIKFMVARLSMLQFFKEMFWETPAKDVPQFFNMNRLMLGESGKTVRDVGQDFSRLQSRDIKTLQQAILYPSLFNKLKAPLQSILFEINEFAAAVCKKPEFLATYNALRTDLAVP